MVVNSDNVESASTNISQDLSNDFASLMPEHNGATQALSSLESILSRASEMQQQGRKLLDELTRFQTFLEEERKDQKLGITWMKNVQKDLKLVDKVTTAASADTITPKIRGLFASLNLPYHILVWKVAKTCSHIIAINKRFYWLPGQETANINGNLTYKPDPKYSTMVTIVCNGGTEWIKVSTITEKRIIWDLAKEGWAQEESDSEDDTSFLDELYDSCSLVKDAEELVATARVTKVGYKHPSVKMYLSRIKAVPDSKPVGQILQKIRDMGIVVHTAEQMPSESMYDTALQELMAGPQYPPLSDTLNLDCTILLAFASDLSHGRVDPSENTDNQSLARQIELECSDLLLPKTLWPASRGKRLVCTHQAATRVKEIITTIGTETEKKRMNLLLNPSTPFSPTTSERLSQFQKLSDYPVPENWNIPIEIIDTDLNTLQTDLPPIAEKVSAALTDLNGSIFLFGWAKGFTTVTSNEATSHSIERIIEEGRVNEETRGPDIWMYGNFRSLVGKEKEKRSLK